MTSIEGIEIYPMISFLIFFTFFLGLFIYVYGGKKKRFETVSQYPLFDEMDQNVEPKNQGNNE